jgi:hypothetical protein
MRCSWRGGDVKVLRANARRFLTSPSDPGNPGLLSC